MIHNNNANPITYPLDITFAKLANILKPGFYRGRLNLGRDSNGRMAECISRGVTFYKDKKEHFINPNLGVKRAVDSIIYGGDNTDNYTAQAITERDGEP